MKNLNLFYPVSILLLALSLVFFSIAYRKLNFYTELTDRSGAVYNGFNELSVNIHNAAVSEPDIGKEPKELTGAGLFFSDSQSVIKSLNKLKLNIRDSINVQISKELNILIRREMMWIIKSNVPDSILHQKAPTHTAALQRIDSLIKKGIQRTGFLFEKRRADLYKALINMKIWVLVFILISLTFLFYLFKNILKQQADKKEKEKALETADRLVAELSFESAEKEKRAAELKFANRELESFSYSVSHDLRAPLRAIHGYTKMLKRNLEPTSDPEADRLMNNIINNAMRMGHLIDDLLNFSRTGRKEMVTGKVNMKEIVTNICAELKIGQEGRDIEFRINRLAPALADNMAIKQVWLNLISNAIKYSGLKEKAVIEIGSRLQEEEIIYFIKDNGAGFDMRYVDKLFGVFQRLHSDDEFEGNGVGLALVQRIIVKHGGRVWGEGKVNEGATFYFTLLNHKP